MLSIMRFTDDIDIEETITLVEAVTRAIVTGYDIRGDQVFIHLKHNDSPTCPICGDGIHSHGHGLCRMCWIVQNSKIGAES